MRCRGTWDADTTVANDTGTSGAHIWQSRVNHGECITLCNARTYGGMESPERGEGIEIHELQGQTHQHAYGYLALWISVQNGSGHCGVRRAEGGNDQRAGFSLREVAATLCPGVYAKSIDEKSRAESYKRKNIPYSDVVPQSTKRDTSRAAHFHFRDEDPGVQSTWERSDTCTTCHLEAESLCSCEGCSKLAAIERTRTLEQNRVRCSHLLRVA